MITCGIEVLKSEPNNEEHRFEDLLKFFQWFLSVKSFFNKKIKYV